MRIVEKRKLWGLSITFLEWTSLQTQEKACNLEESKDDHVFVQGGWVEFNEWVINETLRDMVVEDDEFEKFMTEKLRHQMFGSQALPKTLWNVMESLWKGTILAFQLQCHGAHVHSIIKIHLFEDHTHQA